MVIASIDLMNGKAVQLVQGNENDKKIERDDVLELARDFNRFNEIAVIDLDAALGKDNVTVKGTANRDMIKKLCTIAQCRIGGGIRTVQQAQEWIDAGAVKVIIGSKLFETGDSDGSSVSIDTVFLEELAAAIGKEKIIAAIDTREGQIVTAGWKNNTGLPLLDTAIKLAPFVSEFLFTSVEKEGKMGGPDMDAIKQLRETVDISITAAGGVHTLEEIETLAAIDVDVQLGMALYTGKIKLEDAFTRSLKWKNNLIPVITTDTEGNVLMQAYTDREALAKTFETGLMWYYSRSRQRLWQKGETSGNVQQVVKLRADCDRDSILATVNQTGPACHLGNYSCFGSSSRAFSLEQLYQVVAGRFRNPTPGSYTATLTDKKVREKLLEEAQEVVDAYSRENITWEAADVLYFLTVLLQKEGISYSEVLSELNRRRR